MISFLLDADVIISPMSVHDDYGIQSAVFNLVAEVDKRDESYAGGSDNEAGKERKKPPRSVLKQLKLVDCVCIAICRKT